MAKTFLAISLATLLIASLVLFVPTKPAYAATFTIDSTGGDCNANNTATPIGVWDAQKRMCTLKFNLNGSIDITADGITLNGNKRTLTGDGTGIGVFVGGQTGVTIKNVIVRNFFEGIELDASDSNTLTGNVANSNSIGIFIDDDSDGNTLTGNTANSNSALGIELSSASNGNTLTGNTANSNSQSGIVLSDSDGNTLTSNTANSNSFRGIVLVGGSDGNTLTSNTANSNGFDGIVLNFPAANNVLQKNTASFNIEDGFVLNEEFNTTLKGNTANSNGEFGYSIDIGFGLAFSKNKCSGNGSGGSFPTGFCSPQP